MWEPGKGGVAALLVLGVWWLDHRLPSNLIRRGHLVHLGACIWYRMRRCLPAGRCCY